MELKFFGMAILLRIGGKNLICSMARFFQDYSNCAEVYFFPLSYTIVSCRPCVAIMLSSTLIVAKVLIDVIVITSGN